MPIKSPMNPQREAKIKLNTYYVVDDPGMLGMGFEYPVCLIFAPSKPLIMQDIGRVVGMA
jgi:hypothetical protein